MQTPPIRRFSTNPGPHRLLLFAAALGLAVAAGCGSDSESAVFDASSAVVDSAPTDPDGQAADVDADTSTIDAAGQTDADPGEDAPSSADVDALCMDLCEHRDGCFGEGDVPGCVTDCKADLADCEPGALSAVANCMTIPCQGLDTCLGTIPCVN